MISGYFLRGVNADNILVFRSDDPEELLNVIMRLCASRNKQIKALGEQLELDWYERAKDDYQNKNKDTKKKK